MTTKNKQADDAISRAARYMVAGAVEPDEARAAELHRVAAEMMVEAAQQLSGHFGDEIPRSAATMTLAAVRCSSAVRASFDSTAPSRPSGTRS